MTSRAEENCVKTGCRRIKCVCEDCGRTVNKADLSKAIEQAVDEAVNKFRREIVDLALEGKEESLLKIVHNKAIAEQIEKDVLIIKTYRDLHKDSFISTDFLTGLMAIIRAQSGEGKA